MKRLKQAPAPPANPMTCHNTKGLSKMEVAACNTFGFCSSPFPKEMTDIPCIKYPEIGHINIMMEWYMKNKKFEYNHKYIEYMKYNRHMYQILCDDFDHYLEYLDDKFWKEFFRNKKNQDK